MGSSVFERDAVFERDVVTRASRTFRLSEGGKALPFVEKFSVAKFCIVLFSNINV